MITDKLNYTFIYFMESYQLFLVTLLIVPFLIIAINKLCFKYKILDIPDHRKSHISPTPISGGITIFFTSLIVLNYLNTLSFDYLKFYLDIFIYSTILFLLGLFDDVKKINTNIKTIIILILLLTFLLISNDLNIIFLKFNYLFNKTFVLKYLSIPFTLFCLFMLFNALNYADGKNGISISLSIFWLSYIVLNININFLIILEILLVLFLLLIFNLKNKLFLGNSGVNFISTFVGLLIIKLYNTQNINLFCDEIFLLLLIPGIDAGRVTIYRIIKKKSPLSPDKKHLHHYIEKYAPNNYVWLIYLFLSILPILILKVTDNFFISLLFPCFLYFLCLKPIPFKFN